LKKEKIKKTIIFFSVLLPLIFVNFLMLVFAYSAPTEAPPGGNVSGFLNTSGTTQFKEGALVTSGVFEVLGLKLNPGLSVRPDCDSENEGLFWLELNDAGEADEPFFCQKDFENNFLWTQMKMGGDSYYWGVPVGAVLKSYDGTTTLVDNASTAGRYLLNAGMLVYETVGTYELVIPDNVTSVEVLVVAGGGGSGKGTTTTTYNGGGGGGGGLLYQASYTVIPGTPMSITVGGGGAGSTSTSAAGSNGGNSVFGNLTAIGGGGGGSSSSRPGSAGGSGGGGGRYSTSYGAAGTGNSGQGYNGAASSSSVVSGAGGGSGGPASGITRGPGLSFFGTVYAEGGAGGAAGGVAGTANTGRGGDARPTNSSSNGFAGGSGVVIVRWSKDPVDCSTKSIGDTCGGGKVAYLDGSGGGLIAASADNSTGIEWGCYGTSVGASGTAIGTGASNTSAILSGCATRPIAASVCSTYDGGGYDDWFLPSLDELNELYTNQVAIGGFQPANYWSSTENTTLYAWEQGFDNGSQGGNYKDDTNRVRCVRAF
jgi:hypothetical protein